LRRRCDRQEHPTRFVWDQGEAIGLIAGDSPLVLGVDDKPMPISEAEAPRIKGQVAEGVERPKPTIQFEIGETVRVADGPFASFNGLVEDVDEARSRLKVAVSIIGRPTSVELEFAQVEKV
jgi:transcriptional antiterminator NusG